MLQQMGAPFGRSFASRNLFQSRFGALALFWLASLSGCEASPRVAADAGPDVTEDRTPTECRPLPTPMNFAPPSVTGPLDDVLRVNHMQVKATHNSYHQAPDRAIPTWAYTHAPLRTQLIEQGVRGIELDIHWDPDCQRFQVFHRRRVDTGTSCLLLTDCLLEIRRFSADYPGHAPLFVQIEPKDDDAAFDEARFLALEQEILTVFDRGWIITPDEVQGASDTLANAVSTRGWPTLSRARGRVMFCLDNGSGIRDMYTHGRTNLRERLMFVDSEPGDDFAAVRILNDPFVDAEQIQTALSLGHLVRTRADADMIEPINADRSRLEAALASGAHIISTDYPAAVPGIDYSVEIPGGSPARCSPGASPAGCSSSAIENSELLQPRE